MYIRFLNTLMLVYKHRMANMRGLYSPHNDVLVFISFFQCLNLHVLFKHLVFPDARQCAACHADIRIKFTVIAWGFLFFINALARMGKADVPPLGGYQKRMYFFYFKIYMCLSLLLIVL